MMIIVRSCLYIMYKPNKTALYLASNYFGGSKKVNRKSFVPNTVTFIRYTCTLDYFKTERDQNKLESLGSNDFLLFKPSFFLFLLDHRLH